MKHKTESEWILIVDDTEANRYATSRILRSAGYQYREATTGQEALDFAKGQPALMILDINLPDISGFDVCRQLKSNPLTAMIPVLHLSGHKVTGRDRALGLDGGADGYLVQPVGPEELLATVGSLLRMRRVELALTKSEQRYRNLIESSSAMVWVTDADGRFYDNQKSWQFYTGQTDEESSGDGWQEAIHPANRTEFFDQWFQALKIGSSFHAKGRIWHAPTRSYRHFHCFASRIDNVDGTTREWAFHLKDVEDASRAERERDQLVSLSSDLFCVISNNHFLIRSVNPAWESMLGYHASEVVGKSVLDFVAADDVIQAKHYFETMDTDDDSYFECELKKADGSHLWTQWASSIDSNAIYSIIRDMTEIKLREEKKLSLLSAEKSAREEVEKLYKMSENVNRIKDDFLAMISHELRTPLNVIIGYSELLVEAQLEGHEKIDAIQTIHRNAKSQSQLINDLLDVSRIISNKIVLEMEELELQPLIEGVIDSIGLMAKEKSILIHTNFESEESLILGDRTRLQQILWNLIVNAIKFSPRESSLAISLRIKGDKVVVEVGDSGIGIDPEFIPYVFERFRQENSKTTRKFGGLGLGLAIVKHLTTLHDGTIEAESEGAGKGALFRLTIPHHVQKSRWDTHWSDQWPAPANELDLSGNSILSRLPRGITILVVEDDADSRLFVVNFLAKSGFDVTAAADAAAARKILQTRSFDLLICDIGMPDEDGHAFIKWFRNFERTQGRSPIQAIALTAFAAESDHQRALESGFSIYVAKPFSPKRFLHTICDLNLKN